MKYALLAAMAVAVAPLALASGAHAQDCGPLERVLTSAEDRFESIMYDELDDGFFDASIYLLNADECAVDTIENSYYCLWTWPTVAEADKSIAPLYDMAKVCMSEGWVWSELTGVKTGNTTAITEGYRMTKRTGAHKGAVVQVYMDGIADQQWRQIWLDVAME